MLLISLAALVPLAASLVAAAPLPQDANTPVSTLSVNPAAPSPDVSSSSETTSNTSNPGANLSELLGQLNQLDGQGGSGADETDPDSAPSSAFANFGGGSPAAGANGQGLGGGAASLDGLLQSIQQAKAMTSGMQLESKAGLAASTSARVLAVDPSTSLEPVSAASLVGAAVLAAETTTSPAAASTTTTMVADPALLAAATTTATAAPSIDTAAKFDLNEFLAGASFPAEATTAVPGIVAAAPSAA